jgi:hypothetical protein
MTRIRTRSLLFLPSVLVGTHLFVTATLGQTRPASQPIPTHYPTPAEAGLKSINNPGGGQIIYGVLPNESTMNGAMIAMLRSVHGYFGVRPEVGQFFQARGSDSIATFITINANVQGGGVKAISGLVIVSMPQGSKPLGGAMFDDAAHFGKTQPVMMKTLNEAWRTAGAGTAGPAAPPSASGAAQPLRITTGGDRSAAIGLPEGWQLTDVAGGMLRAMGPNGEVVFLGMVYQNIYDPRNPQTQRELNSPVLARVQHTIYPYGGDPFQAYVAVTNQLRQINHLAPGDFKLISSQPQQANQFEAVAVLAIMELDLHDGKGLRSGSVRIGISKPRGLPTWSMSINGSQMPKAVAAQDAATIKAMVASYSQDAGVIGRETQAAIDNIHAIGARAKQQAADADSRRVASSQAFNQHMDNIDRQSKAFQNYQFDSSQLQVTNGNEAARGTVSNGTAAALVQADPEHFQIVQTQNFIKGVDY